MVQTIVNPTTIIQEEFPGSSLSADWTSSVGAGQTVAIANSSLTINLGNSVSTTLIKSVATSRLPAKAGFLLSIENLGEGQQVRIGLVNSGGTHSVSVLLDSSGYAKILSVNAGLGSQSRQLVIPSSSIGKPILVEINCFSDGIYVYFENEGIDSDSTPYIFLKTIPGYQEDLSLFIETINGEAIASNAKLKLESAYLITSAAVGGGGGVADSVSVTNFPSDPAKNTTIQQVRDRLPQTLGQKTLAESLSVAIASGQQLLVNTAPPNLIVPTRIAKETTAEEDLIPSPGVGQKLLVHRVVAYNLSTTAEQTIILTSSDGTFPYPSMIISAKDKDGFWDSLEPGFELTENTALRVSQLSDTLVHYSVQYRVEAV